MPMRSEARYRRRRLTAVIVILAAAAGVTWATMAAWGEFEGSSGRSVASELPTPTPSASATLPPATEPLPGYLLIADRGNDRLLLVDGAKHVLWRYPHGNPPYPFHFDDDSFFNRNYSRIITNQEEQQTIEVLSFPQGSVVWHYGHPNVPGAGAGQLSTPDDAYLLPGAIRSVADVGNCRILFISPTKEIVRQIGTTGVCGHDPPRLLSAPNGDTPYSKGRMLVTEITGSWIDAIGPHNKLLWAVQAPVVYPSDAQWLGHGRILLADYSKPGHVLIMTRTGKVLWSYGPASGKGALDHPSLAMRLPNGLIAVNDDFNDRVVLIDPSRHRIVWQYGHHNRPGTGAGFLRTPDGMDFLPYDVARRDPTIRHFLLQRLGR